jgi:thiamine biosynthesis lipoprotein
MGTRLCLSLQAGTRSQALAASEAAIRAVSAAEGRLSTWRTDSELSRLNACPAGEPFQLSEQTAAELRTAVRWWEATGGVFDPGVGSLCIAFGLRTGGRIPTSGELARAREGSGLRHLRLQGNEAVRLHPGLVLDEGGFGKGAALDRACAAAVAAGASELRLDFGGQILVAGGRQERIALAHPRHRDEPLCELWLQDGSAATSGNSERGVSVAGRRIGHLLDPSTGAPAEDWGSLTAVAEDALSADCLSKLFAAGPDAALRFAAGRPDIAVVALVADGDQVRIRASAALRGRLRTLVPGVEVEFAATAEEGSR